MKTKYGKDHCEPIVESVAMVRLPIVIVCIAMVSIAIVSIASKYPGLREPARPRLHARPTCYLVIPPLQACVEPPDPVYTPRLPHALLHGERGFADQETGWGKHEPGALSAAQLEALVYAGQRHSCHNGDGERSGFSNPNPNPSLTRTLTLT